MVYGQQQQQQQQLIYGAIQVEARRQVVCKVSQLHHNTSHHLYQLLL